MERVLLSILIFVSCTHFANADAIVCKSIDITHQRELYKLRECTTVVGHVKLSNFRIHESYRDIVSNVEEITDFLLVYRVEELISLDTLFPNLTIIRGNKLLFDKYSLVVYENRNMRDLGLRSLLKIRKGSIRIESNPVLCFSDTVNWVYLMEDPLSQHYSLNNNLDPNECPVCETSETSDSGYFKNNCWSLEYLQLKKPLTYHDNCPEACGSYGCDKNGQCCSSLCLTGCSAEKCRICKNFKNLHGDCVEYCSIPNYMYLDRCIPDEVCRKKEWIPHRGACIEECPKSYQQDFLMGDASCSVNCRHNYTINSKDDLDDLRECVTVKGYIHIELRDDKSILIGELEKALGEIKEIVGYLKVVKSPQLVSLGFFKKLDTIIGEQLVDGEFSIHIVDNPHLEEIWPENHKVAILKGRMFIHMNPRLCFEKIMQLAPSMKSDDIIRVKDASRNSNGMLVNCGDQFTLIHPVVEAVNATAARIKIEPVSSSSTDLILGYLHFYKEALNRNVSMFDGMHGCGNDDWKMHMTLDLNVRHVLRNLKPNTQYAFFVKSISHVDEHRGASWQSNIQYFKTLPTKPGPILKLYGSALSANALIFHWWPPRSPNGVIDSFRLRYETLHVHTNYSNFRGYSASNLSSSCECEFQKSKRGPVPSELKFYNRQVNFVETALPNVLYISSNTIKMWREELKQEDNTRRRRDTRRAASATANKVATNAEELRINPTDDEEEQQEKFRQYTLLMERSALLRQDTGTAGYEVDMPLPLCALRNPSERYRKEHKCDAVEHYPGIEIPGTNYSYVLENLRENTVYRVYVRACAQGIENGCGPEKSAVAETVSAELENLIDDPQFK